MPRIKRLGHSPKFAGIQQEAKAHGEGRKDCTVKALALLLGVPYAAAHDAMAAEGRQRGKGAYIDILFRAAKRLGFRLEYMPIKDRLSIIQNYPGAHKGLHGITTHHPARFPKAWASVPNCIMVTARHVAAFIDGEVHDWSASNALRVTDLIVITERPAPGTYEDNRSEAELLDAADQKYAAQMPELDDEPLPMIDGKDPLVVLQEMHAATMAARRNFGKEA